MIKKFEDILAWQKSQDLAVDVYNLTGNWRDFDFVRQIRRAAVSVSCNIAEGYDRRTTPDFRRFLFIAKASCSEVRSLLELSLRLKYLSLDEKERLTEQTKECSRLIQGFIQSMK